MTKKYGPQPDIIISVTYLAGAEMVTNLRPAGPKKHTIAIFNFVMKFSFHRYQLAAAAASMIPMHFYTIVPPF